MIKRRINETLMDGAAQFRQRVTPQKAILRECKKCAVLHSSIIRGNSFTGRFKSDKMHREMQNS